MNQQKTHIIKGADVIGLKVITLLTGEEIKRVDDIIYEPQTNKVRALVVDSGGVFSGAKVLLLEDVTSIGKDAVIIQDKKIIKRVSDVGERIAHIAYDDTYLTRTRIITEDGVELGHVSDVYFSFPSGEVIDFEVSQGLKDFQSGKKRVQVGDIITIGKDATIVKGYTEEKFEQQAWYNS